MHPLGGLKSLAKRKRKDISPEAAAAEQRRKESERLREIEKEMRSIAPFIKEDRDIMLRFLDLQEEKLKIHQDRGTLHTDGHNPFFLIKVERLLLRATTDGKIPVSLGEELASLFAENGYPSGAAQIRRATQRAFENGERFFKSEHLKDSE